jgi:hypothetical protein
MIADDAPNVDTEELTSLEAALGQGVMDISVSILSISNSAKQQTGHKGLVQKL